MQTMHAQAAWTLFQTVHDVDSIEIVAVQRVHHRLLPQVSDAVQVAIH
jgi:hypothetical protein